MSNSTASLDTLLLIPLNRGNTQSMIDMVLDALPPPLLNGAGAGYVICAGGRYARYGYATIRWIREVLHDPAPIECWVGSNEVAVFPAPPEGWSNITFRQGDTPGGWPLKARAVLHSSFEKVVLLDSDCIPFIPLHHLLSSPAVEQGALFFPDVANHRKDDVAYSVLKLRPEEYPPEMEAGQLFIDRPRHALPIVLTDYFNSHPEFFYWHHHGDKDLWALAFSRLRVPFTTAAPCQGYPWGLRHFLPDGTHYSDHLIHIKNGQQCPHPEYQQFLREYQRAVSPQPQELQHRPVPPPPPPMHPYFTGEGFMGL